MKLLNLLQGMRTSAPIVPLTTPAIRGPTLDITFVTKVYTYIGISRKIFIVLWDYPNRYTIQFYNYFLKGMYL